MKATTILAVLATSTIAAMGVTAHAVPEAVVEVPNGHHGYPKAHHDHKGLRPCWHDPDDSIKCPVVQRDAEAQPCFAEPGGNLACPLKKRETCWEAPDGQIHCTNPPAEKRETCWEAPDGQIHCTNPPLEKRADATLTLADEIDKRDPQSWTCWENPDGQIHCVVEPPNLKKRDGPAYQAPNGQVHWPVIKRVEDAGSGAFPVLPGTSKFCGTWYNVTYPDPLACSKALAAGKIDLAQFRAINTDVNADCSNLLVGYAYCLGTTVRGTFRTAPSSLLHRTRTTSTTSAPPHSIARPALSGVGPYGQCRYCHSSSSSAPPSKSTSRPRLMLPLRPTDLNLEAAASASASSAIFDPIGTAPRETDAAS